MIRCVLFLSGSEMMSKYDNLHQTLRVSFFSVGNICDDHMQPTTMTMYTQKRHELCVSSVAFHFIYFT
jgi:hypothetical protein